MRKILATLSITIVALTCAAFFGATTANAQVIVNEFKRNGTFATTEYVEILLTQDMTATQLQTYFVGDSQTASNSKLNAFKLANMSAIATNFKAGTIIVVGGTGAGAVPTENISYNPVANGTNDDWNILLQSTGTRVTFAPGTATAFDFAGTDVAWIDTASTGTTSIHSIAYAANNNGTFANAATVKVAAPADPGFVEYLGNNTGLATVANYSVNTVGSIGVPNSGTNTTYINGLRNAGAVTPSISLSVSSNAANEATPDTIITVTATASSAVTADTVVTLTPSGTATSVSDYTLGSTTITILSGQTVGTTTFKAINDNIIDAGESAVLTITNVTGSTATIGTPSMQTITIADNGVAGVTISKTAVSATEGGANDTYTIVLNSQPTANVFVTIMAGGTQGTVTPTTLTFTALNFSTPQTVTFAAVNDNIDEADSITQTITHNSTSADTLYDNKTIASVTGTTVDNDTAGVTVTPTTVNVAEGGAGATYTVRLNSQPTADVTVTITPNSQITTSAATLTFTAANFATPQTVTVTAVDDMIIETATHAGLITQSATSIDDPKYNGAAMVSNVTANITDNDKATVNLSVDTNTASEPNGVFTFTATASSATVEPQTVSLNFTGTTTGADFAETFPKTITIPTGATTGTTTVNINDDTIIEGDETAAFSISNPSSGLTLGTTTTQNTTVTDNDTTDLTITLTDSPDPATVGGNLVYTLRVTNVGSPGTVANGVNATFILPEGGYVTTPAPTVDKGRFDSFTIDGRLVTFTNANFTASGVDSTATMTVTITPNAVSTALRTGDAVIDSSMTIRETNETNNTAPAVATAVNLAAVPTINLSPESLFLGRVVVGETSAEGSYTVSSSNLTADITITAAAPFRISRTSGGPYSQTLTAPANTSTVIYVVYNPTATVSNNVLIRHASTGATTRNLDASGMGVAKVDLSVTPSMASEPSGTFTFTVTANAPVSGDQMLKLNLMGGTASGADFTNAFPETITISNGTTTKTATVTIKDDLNAEGDETATFTISNPTGGIVLGTTTSQAVTVNDNDAATITVTPTTLALSENGVSKTYSVALSSQPTSNVTINVSPNSQLTTDVAMLTFTPANFATPQTVTVTAKDDRIAQGTRDAAITQSVTTTDPSYTGSTVATVNTTITDDDSVGLVITPLSVNVTEGGATATYTVKLNSQPLMDVIVTTDGGAQTTTSPASLTFGVKDFDTEQIVTVTAKDDFIAEGEHTQTITNVTASNDNAYGNVSKNVTATITDNDIAGVTVTPTAINVTEGGTTATYTVVLTSQPTSDVTITITPDAQISTDKVTLTFTAANYAMPQTVTVTAVNDVTIEGTHTGTITQSASSTDTKYNNATVASVTATITDNDFPTVEISASPKTATEAGVTLVTLTATASQAVTGDQTVTLALSGTATANDFDAATPTSITILSGQTTGSVTVTVTDDAIVEGDETATFTISNPSSGITLGTKTSDDVTITDNDISTIDLSVSPNATSENTPNETVTVTATASKKSAKPQTVTVAISGTNITTGDATFDTTTITIPADSLTGFVTLTILDDAIVEGNETATLTISAPSAGSAIGTATQTVTIADNDKPTVSVTVDKNTATETGATVVTVTATASDNVYNGDQTVTLAVSGTNITAGDFTLNTTTITIPNGAKTGTATFTVVDDALIEGTETATLTISNPSSNITLVSPTTQDVTITDNDFPTVSLSVTPATALENGSFTFKATSSQAVVGNQTVKLNLDAGVSATSADFTTTLPQTITILDGQTEGTVTVSVNDDTIVEGDETASFSISEPTNGVTLGTPTTQTVTITDNDKPTVSLSVDSNTATETGATVVTVTATASDNVFGGDQTVELTVTGTNITTGDYSLNNLTTNTVTITIPNGTKTGTATFKVVDDTLIEGTETAILTISNPSSNITLGTPTTQNITITDNDSPSVTITSSPKMSSEAGVTLVTLTATASEAVSGDQTVTLALSGKATANDFDAAIPTTITIKNGETTGSVTVTVADDALVEDTETATFTISNPSNGISLGTKISDDIQIVDNDKASVNLSVTSNTGREDGTTQITVTATASSNVFGGNQTVDINTSGLAIAGTDYTLDNLTITIPEGSNSGSVTFTVINDTIAEGTENAVLTIVNPSSNITLGTNRTETIAITDNDVTDLTTTVTAPMKAFRYVKFDYVITVENLSSINAENVQVNFTLPTGDGVTFSYSGFTTSAGSGFVCANPDANRTIVCTKGKVLGTTAQSVKGTENAIQQTATINLTVAANENGVLDNRTSNAIVDPINVLTETNETNNTANLATSSGNQTTTVSMVTAAGISATGKVINTKGRGIARVSVTITDTTTNETRSTFTTTNGEFSFDKLDSGHYYIVTVKAKRFTFDENQQGFQAFENTDLTFRANR